MPASEVLEVNKIYQGDAEYTLKTFDEDTFDSFVSDPPYGLKFMGKHWDYDVPKVSIFKEMFRTLKPGGYILIACGTRTQHRMAVNIEDAGFEIRDVISWLYGSGFPKSLDISKAIDKKFGAEREVVGEYKMPDGTGRNFSSHSGSNGNIEYGHNEGIERLITEPSTDEAKQWEGWGTALKPAQEFWTLARKPLSEKTVAENVLKHGTGGINIDACRIEGELEEGRLRHGGGIYSEKITQLNPLAINSMPSGRFPSNVILDEFMGKELDKQSGISKSTGGSGEKSMGALGKNGKYGKYALDILADNAGGLGDEGGASRFFYCAKADNFQRNKGLKDFDKKEAGIKNDSGRGFSESDPYAKIMRANHHPTVKPIDLMRYLVKLITPKGGLTCDPFCGSGTTLIGAKLELINFIGIEREKEYREIAEARVAAWNPEKYKEQELF